VPPEEGSTGPEGISLNTTPLEVDNLRSPIFKLAARISVGYGLIRFVSMASGVTAQNQEKLFITLLA